MRDYHAVLPFRGRSLTSGNQGSDRIGKFAAESCRSRAAGSFCCYQRLDTSAMITAPNPLYFLVCFPILWFAVTLILSRLSGWFALMERYPDQAEDALDVLANQSGSLGVVSMRGILTLSVCRSGLRIGIMRIFGPFCKDFFVPWTEITITRVDRFFWTFAKLTFGHPSVGRLTVFAHTADRMARAAGDHWPEPGPFPEETGSRAFSRIAKQWVAMTLLAAAFFIIVPRLVGAKGANAPPIAVAVLFPAVVFGIAACIQYVRERSSK